MEELQNAIISDRARAAEARKNHQLELFAQQTKYTEQISELEKTKKGKKGEPVNVKIDTAEIVKEITKEIPRLINLDELRSTKLLDEIKADIEQRNTNI